MASVTKAELAAQVKALRASLAEERARSARLESIIGEAREQQAATSDIIAVISSAATDVQPVFDAIVASAARLCDAAFSAVARFDGAQLHHRTARPHLERPRPHHAAIGGSPRRPTCSTSSAPCARCAG